MDPDQRGSRTLLSAVFLTAAGGYLDAYTYFVRGGVFANAQTANVVRFGIAAAEMNIGKCLYYLYPILAFTAGVMLSLWVEDRTESWPRRNVLIVEILFMIIISFLPEGEMTNICANIMVSFICAMQMQSFQIFRKQGIATTVATGNLRKAVEYLYTGIRNHDGSRLKTSAEIFMILMIFVMGVTLGTLISKSFGVQSILVPAGMLVIVFIHITAVRKRVLGN